MDDKILLMITEVLTFTGKNCIVFSMDTFKDSTFGNMKNVDPSALVTPVKGRQLHVDDTLRKNKYVNLRVVGTPIQFLVDGYDLQFNYTFQQMCMEEMQPVYNKLKNKFKRDFSHVIQPWFTYSVCSLSHRCFVEAGPIQHIYIADWANLKTSNFHQKKNRRKPTRGVTEATMNRFIEWCESRKREKHPGQPYLAVIPCFDQFIDDIISMTSGLPNVLPVLLDLREFNGAVESVLQSTYSGGRKLFLENMRF